MRKLKENGPGGARADYRTGYPWLQTNDDSIFSTFGYFHFQSQVDKIAPTLISLEKSEKRT